MKHWFEHFRFLLQSHPDKKTFIITFLIFLALPLTIGAVFTVQNLKQKASGNDNFKILDAPNGSSISQTSNTTVYLQITLPSDWILPAQSRNNSFIKQAYAQSIPNGYCAAPDSRTCTQESCGGEANVGNCTFGCPSGYTWCSGGICIGSCPAPTQPPAQPTATPKPSGCERNKFDSTYCRRCASDGSFWGTPGTDFGDTPAGSGQWCICAQTYKPDLYRQYCVAQPTAVSTQTPAPTATTQPGVPTAESSGSPSPAVHILKQIIIENKDDGRNGDQKRTIPDATTTILDALTKKIPWKLNDLNSDQPQATRTVQVTLFDGKTTYTPLVATITLTKPGNNLPSSTISPTGGAKFFRALSTKQPIDIQSRNNYGMQIDLSDRNKIPSSTQFSMLQPGWVRFVYRFQSDYGSNLPSVPSSVRKLVVFNNESANGKFPEGSNDIVQWKDYVDRFYITTLEYMLKNEPRIDAIEVWNEEDICPSNDYCPGMPAKAYAYMLRRASEVIKQHKSSTAVVMGGMGSGDNVSGYIAEMKQSDPSVFDKVDAVGLHPYGRSPNGWCTANGQVYE